MSLETKEQVFERVMSMEKPICPHCEAEMNIWEVPPINFSDGLGWGSPYLFVCFNDDCPIYSQGWEHIMETYAHNASYRCFCYPDTKKFEFMPVFSAFGGTGQIIDDQVVAAEQALKENTKKGFSLLAECYVSKDSPNIASLLLDPGQPVRVRVKAAEMLGDIGEPESVEALQNFRTGNQLLEKEVNEAVRKIHERYFTRECPFCAEVIKKRAKICKHCGKEVAGQ